MADDVILAKYRLELADFRKDMDSINKKFDSQSKQTKKQTDGMKSSFKEIGGAIAGAFAVGQLIEFGKKIIDITGEFQKFEAVLTNTLGSQGAAKIAMGEIVKFASTTPFQVKELTEAFVKLANQGFRPTIDQMRQLGDLAASTGKTFDMLAEAIIDAQVGEFERLKEFGIRAEKQGDQVTFTFKGVKTQVDFATESIQNYILSLGDLNGVAGATDAISKTLTGQISMLTDAVDLLMVSIGQGSSGVLNDFISSLTEIVQDITEVTNRSKGFEKSLARLALFGTGADLGSIMDEPIEKQKELNAGIITVARNLKNLSKEAQNNASDLNDYANALSAIADNLSDGDEPVELFTSQLKELKDIQSFLNEDSLGYLNLQREIISIEEQRAKAIELVNIQLEREKFLMNAVNVETINAGESMSVSTEKMEQQTELRGQFVDSSQYQLKTLNQEMAVIENKFDNVNLILNSLGATMNQLNLNEKQSALLQIALSQAQIIASAAQAAAKAGAQAGAGAPIVTPAILATVLAATLPNVIAATQIVRNSKVPKYYEGTEYLTGARGKDQIPILANYGERIIPTLDNAKIGRDLSNKELVDAAVMYKAFKRMGNQSGIDYQRMDKIERKGALTIANKLDVVIANQRTSQIENKLSWNGVL